MTTLRQKLARLTKSQALSVWRKLPGISEKFQLPKSVSLHWTQNPPKAAVATLPGGRVFGFDVISANGSLLNDLSTRCEFDSELDRPEIRCASFQKFRLPAPKKLSGMVISLVDRWPDNYFHWMTLVLPRLSLFEQVVSLSEVSTVLVPPLTKAFQKITLEMLGIPTEKLYFVSEHDHVQAEHLYATPHYSMSEPWVLPFLRKSFLPKTAVPVGKRIYISRERSNGRRVRNEAEVWALLSQHGFTKEFLEEMPFRDQVSLFASADVIVAPHGAGLTNTCFCRPGTRVIEFLPDGFYSSLFPRLVRSLDLEFIQMGERIGKSSEESLAPCNDAISVDLSLLGKYLEQIGQITTLSVGN